MWDHKEPYKDQKSKCKVLHLGQGNPRHEYRLREELIETSPGESLGALAGEKLDMTWQCELTAPPKANDILGCIKRGVASGSREDPPSLLCPHETPPGVLNSGLESSAHKPVRAGPEEEHKDNQGAGAPLL